MRAPHTVSRRRFLRGIGGTAVALPYLPSVMGESWAQGQKPPRRFIFVFTSNSQLLTNWYPVGALAPQSWKQLDRNVREAPLAGPGPISNVLGESFAPLKSKLLLLRGLDFVTPWGGGHNPASPLSGHAEKTRRHVTIDQLMAYSRAVYPTPPPVGQPRSVHLLIKGWQQATYVSTTRDGAAIPHEIDVSKSWNTLFGGFIDPTAPGADVEKRRQALRIAVMDRVRGDYQRLKASPRLGASDRARLDAHLSFLNDLEARLRQGAAAAPGRGCERPAQPRNLSQGSEFDDANLPSLTKTNIDMLVASIRCDRTRVATLMLCPGTDRRTFAFLGGIGDHHALSHQMVAAREKLIRINRWYADQVAYLLTQLNQIEDPVTGATYLDNSIVYWGNEDGCSDGDAHEGASMPVLLAGSAGGQLRTGRYVDYREVTTVNGQDTGLRPYYNATSRKPSNRDIIGRPYNSLLITLMRLMGLDRAEYEAPGQTGFGAYNLNINNQYNLSDGQKELPHLRA